MSKKKSLFVTLLMGAMTIAILFGLYGMHHTSFMALAGCFAAYGFANACGAFCAWLGKEATIDPVSIKHLPKVEAEPVETVEDIIAEMRGSNESL